MASILKRGENYYLMFRTLTGKQIMERLLIDGDPVTQLRQAEMLKSQREREIKAAKREKLLAIEQRCRQIEEWDRKDIEEHELWVRQQEGELPEASSMSPDDFIKEVEAWANEDTTNRKRRSRNTIINYKNAWNKFFKYAPVDRLQDVNYSQISLVIKSWEKDGMQPKGILAYIVTLKSLYNYAIEWEKYKGENPFTKFGKDLAPRLEDDIPKYLEEEDADRFLTACKSHSVHLHLYTSLMLYLGLRRNEALNVRWEAVNWNINQRMARTGYPSDVTDAQWRLLEPLIPPAHAGGRPRSVDMREVLNGIFYVLRTGASWRQLPHDLPPWGTVPYYYWRFRRDGTWQTLHDGLRDKVRRKAGKKKSPSAAILDSQSVKTTEKGGLRATTRARR